MLAQLQTCAFTFLIGSALAQGQFFPDYFKELTGKTVNVTFCSFRYEREDGYLYSPDYPFDYPPLSDCIYEFIRPSEDYCGIKFFVEQLGIEGEEPCDQDFLEVLSCQPRESARLANGNICGLRIKSAYFDLPSPLPLPLDFQYGLPKPMWVLLSRPFPKITGIGETVDRGVAPNHRFKTQEKWVGGVVALVDSTSPTEDTHSSGSLGHKRYLLAQAADTLLMNGGRCSVSSRPSSRRSSIVVVSLSLFFPSLSCFNTSPSEDALWRSSAAHAGIETAE
ncbi:unnamed protein product [Cyprideis torosa]|uniref:Uncharacterized protein n=1 Tax=Cyprideis torosa TaxID=163714 RepID=A0A7R8ZN49_9CRUS|nr:unnamed protein product [Cyprideis torosa]CAG0885804.1 unnamed protein product [Cyprideis torosa]